MSTTSNWISTADTGHKGHAGDSFSTHFAGVKKTKGGQFELHVHYVWGSNQGYLEAHGRVERRYRAPNLDELMRIGIAEIRGDSEFEDNASSFVAAIREAVFEAQDKEA